jgi:putative DNA primase/helicase
LRHGPRRFVRFPFIRNGAETVRDIAKWKRPAGQKESRAKGDQARLSNTRLDIGENIRRKDYSLAPRFSRERAMNALDPGLSELVQRCARQAYIAHGESNATEGADGTPDYAYDHEAFKKRLAEEPLGHPAAFESWPPEHRRKWFADNRDAMNAETDSLFSKAEPDEAGYEADGEPFMPQDECDEKVRAREARDRAKAARRKSNGESAQQGEQKQETFLIKASEITPVPISWVWAGWLARGKLHIIAGVPETGKTTCALSFAAIISAGQRWPDGVQAKLGNVLIWSNEDEDDDTIVPRLMQMGADLDRIFIVKGHADANGKRRPFNPSTDMGSLREKAATIEGGVDLLILDPVVAAVPVTKNTNGNSETRAGLQPVKDFAEAIRAACIGITHFSKGTSGKDPLERVTGSLVYGALPRLVMMTSKNAVDGPDEPPKILVRAKSNIGESGGGFGYEIVAAPLYENPEIIATRIVWREEPLEGDARELLADAEGEDPNGKVSKVDQAKLFLKRALDHRERRQTEIESEAKSEGISTDALKRASREGVKKRRDGILGVWFWRKQEEHFP